MERIEHFVPGISDDGEGFLASLRWPIPAGVTTTYATAYTEPGERVLVPFCQGAEVVRELLSAGRQAVALNFDPLLVLLVRTELTLPPVPELDGAVARLGDSLKQGVPLRRYLADLYVTTCPACLRPAVADYFVWDRERGSPIAKYLHCEGCDWQGRAALEPEDLRRLEQLPAPEMHYHYVLERVSPPARGGTAKNRLEYLLELYSPRNLYALAELTRKIEGQFPEGPLQDALKVLLADCLDRCSSLAPLPDSMARRRGLTRPGRYLERNVWFAFEDAVTRLEASVRGKETGLADALEAKLAKGGDSGSYVGHMLVRDLPRTLSPRSMCLILTSPPPLDSAAWSLSYLWGAWVLGAEAAAPMRPLLLQRTPDPAWYARVMAGSLATLADFLRDDGRLVLVLTDQRPAMVEALVLAADQARLGVMSLVQCGRDYRLELAPSLPQPDALLPEGGSDAEKLDDQIRRAVVEIGTDAIKARGEPLPWPALHAAIHAKLARSGILGKVAEDGDGVASTLDRIDEQVEAALDDPAFVRLAGGDSRTELWWLAFPDGTESPLSDRVEVAAHEILRDSLGMTEDDYTARLYAGFPGTLTPGAELAGACLRSYGSEPTPGYWQLRPEDMPEVRQAEQRLIVEHLQTLGRRLGYRMEGKTLFDAAWLEGGQVRAVFTVHWRAMVGDALALSEHAAGARPYLVIPGGRAALVSHKLAHNPLWQRTVDEYGWWFIKYRHVRKLVEQAEIDEYTLRTIVGLDPIVEREVAQIPLF
jgi:hypothetical protein